MDSEYWVKDMRHAEEMDQMEKALFLANSKIRKLQDEYNVCNLDNDKLIKERVALAWECTILREKLYEYQASERAHQGIFG